jgi:hypothetical protein
VDEQVLVAAYFVKQSICEVQPNVLHLNLKNEFNHIILHIIVIAKNYKQN